MASGPPGVPRLHRLFLYFDPEAAGVVSIILGLFQVMLSVPLYYMQISRPKALFLIPFHIGCLIVAGGSMGVATERNPSRRMLKSCAYTNIASLLGTLVALCVYGITFNSIEPLESCIKPTEAPQSLDPTDMPSPDWYHGPRECAADYLENFFFNVTVMLLLYDLAALLLQALLSVSAYKGLKAN